MTGERTLVLGSGSPYRRALLHRLGLAFEVIVPGIPEGLREGEPPASAARRLALEKACAVAERAPESLVIGCDQVAEVEGRGLGKPLDRLRNVAQLTLLSGKQVAFRTGLCLLDAATGRVQSEVVDTFVAFGPSRSPRSRPTWTGNTPSTAPGVSGARDSASPSSSPSEEAIPPPWKACPSSR